MQFKLLAVAAPLLFTLAGAAPAATAEIGELTELGTLKSPGLTEY